MANVAIIQATDSAQSSPPGVLGIILLLSMVIAYPLSFGVLRLYRRKLLRSMRTGTDPTITEHLVSPEASAMFGRPAQMGPDLVVLNRDSPIATAAPAETLCSEALYKPWRAAAVYVAGGFCFALVMAAASIASMQLGFRPLLFLTLFWIYAWPVVLTVSLVAAGTRRTKLAIVFVYFVVFAALSATVIARSPALDWGQIVLLLLLLQLPATLLLLIALNLRIRAVAPLVLVFTVVGLTASQLALSMVGSNMGLLRSIAGLGVALGLNAYGTFITFIIVFLVVFLSLGWLTLQWIGNRYEQQKISDQSITLDAIWLLSGIIESIVLFSGGAVFLLSGFLAFAAYKVVARVGFWLLSRKAAPASAKNTKLLLLRVFSLGKLSERLFDALAKRWRYVGGIRLIAGPDLATTTVEPHELLDFLRGKLGRRFIDGPQTLDLRISEMDLVPDPDGRFRVNDFFCHDHTWQMTLSRLAGDSDAVLMDLRGFSSQNSGVVFEIEEVINLVPLGRVVFVVDDTTDEEFLRQTVQRSWDRMKPTSPNQSSTPGELKLFRFTGSRGELRQLLHTV